MILGSDWGSCGDQFGTRVLTWASTKWPIRILAMTGIVTASMMDLIISGSLCHLCQ